MKEFSADNFFDLNHFFHISLFKEVDLVWEALSKLSFYLSSLSLGKISVPIPSSVTLVAPHLIVIEEGTIIEPNVYIEGPCWIGRGCQIRHGAYLRKNIILGENCIIGHGSEIKHSIFLNKAKASHLNYVGDSIIGNQTNLGAGVKCANARLDGEEVKISYQDQRLSSGLKKLGAIVGDRSQIGCNSVINPGTLIAKDKQFSPCLSISSSLLTLIQGKT